MESDEECEEQTNPRLQNSDWVYMELWYIILGCCIGAILLFGYVGVVLYKTCHNGKKRGHPIQDPAKFTEEKDWPTIINENDVSARKEDGLCLDTWRRSSIYHKGSISEWPIPQPKESEVPNGPENALRSVLKLGVLVMTPPSSPNNNNDGEDKEGREPGVTELVTYVNEDSKPSKAESVRGTQPDLLPIMSTDLQKDKRRRHNMHSVQRSRTFHGRRPEYERPSKPDGCTPSFAEPRRKGGNVNRSRSFQERTGEKSPSNSSVFLIHGSSVNSEERNEKLATKEGRKKDQQTVVSPRKRKAENKHEGCESKSGKGINRSDSAPSVGGREKVREATTANAPPRRSHSVRWIPEPDYHSISIEKLISQYSESHSREKEDRSSSRKNEVCSVVTVNTPRNEQVKTDAHLPSTLGGMASDDLSKVQDTTESSTGASIPKPTSPTQQHGVSPTSYGSVPGAAKRVNDTSVSSEQTTITTALPGTRLKDSQTTNQSASKEHSTTGISYHVSPPPANDNSKPFQNWSQQQAKVDKGVSVSPSPVNENSKPSENWSQQQAKVDKGFRGETSSHKNLVLTPSGKTERLTDTRTVGKMTIVKHVEGPSRNERSFKCTSNNDSSASKYTAEVGNNQQRPSLKASEGVDSLSGLKKSEEPKKAVHQTCTAPPQSDEVQKEAQVTILPQSSTAAQLLTSEIVAKAQAAKDRRAQEKDIDQIMEERKKNWKREQIIDKLQSARARNQNSNYIFGTGLAYQSCMPELQDMLKRRSVAT